MAQTLAQMIGRIMRAPDDRGETAIFDNNFYWAGKVLAPYFAGWVRPLIQRSYTVPKPPPPLAIERGER
jgi:Rad3-related DNA helicase